MAIQHSTSPDSGMASRLLTEVQHEHLELPTLPESIARISAYTESGSVSLGGLARIVQQDPGISCQLLRVVNSAPYLAEAPVASLNVAIRKLGLRYACELSDALASRLAFQATNDMIDRRFRSAVADAVYVGAASAVLAKNYTELAPERARTAGLFHNVGAYPIIEQAEYENFTDTFALQNIVEAVQVSLSTSILKRGNFPEELCCLPKSLSSYERQREAPTLLDLVAAAVALNAALNHDEANRHASQPGKSIRARIRELPQAASLLIYEITGFDPHAEISQISELQREIESELCVAPVSSEIADFLD